jgi:hypothetical protein
MPEYLVEIRLAGYAKEYTRRLMYAAARRFSIRGVTKDSPLPSITVYGPFKTDREAEVVAAMSEAAGGHDIVSYRIKGFGHFKVEKKWLVFDRGLRGIFLDIEPSERLRHLRAELARRLDPICSGAPASGEHSFHAMLEFGDLGGRFDSVLAYLAENEERDLSQRLLRITLVRDGSVLCEYDLVERKSTLKARLERRPDDLRTAITSLRRTGGETLQPIWDRAHAMTSFGRRPRQLTLVDDSPALRLPRLLKPRPKAAKPRKPAAPGRQVTLVEEDPAARLPDALRPKAPRKGKPKGGEGRTVQKTLSEQGEDGYVIPWIRLPLRFGGDKAR